MAKKLDDDTVLRIVRGSVTESAAATFTEIQLDTQLSVERGVIWQIHFIEFGFRTQDIMKEVGAGNTEKIQAQITREAKTDIESFQAADTLQGAEIVVARKIAIGTDAGPLYWVFLGPNRYDFPIPMSFAGQNIYFGIKGTDSTAIHTVDFRIGYTIREVSDKFFFRVASSLLS